MSGRTTGDGMGKLLSNDAVLHAAEVLVSIGTRVGAIVRADVGDSRIGAAILTGYGVPVLTINVAMVGTDALEDVTTWALAKICDGTPGFHLLRAD